MSDIKIPISSDKLSKIRETPLWFYELKSDVVKKYNYETRTYTSEEDYWWETSYNEINIKTLSCDDVKKNWGICSSPLLVISNVKDIVVDNNPGFINVHKASGSYAEDLKCIFDYLIYKESLGDKRFSFKEILWVLDSQIINETAIIDAFRFYNNKELNIIINRLSEVTHCLCLTKQRQLKNIFVKFGKTFNVYRPHFIIDSINVYAPNIPFDNLSVNIFYVIDFILGHYLESFSSYNRNINKVPNTNDNDFVKLAYWLSHSNYVLDNYNCLQTYFCFLSQLDQRYAINRYFYDAYKKRITIDFSLLASLRVNQYYMWDYYRKFTMDPASPYNLTISLYLDSIITLKQSNGKELATFNGVLDRAMSNVEYIRPDGDFKLNGILPVCDGGYRINYTNFKGFITYRIYYVIKEWQQVEKLVEDWCVKMLNKLAIQKMNYICKIDKSKEIVDKCYRFDCCQKKWSGIWVVEPYKNIRGVKILQLFLKKDLTGQSKFEISEEDISTELLKERYVSFIESISSKHEWNNSLLYEISRSTFNEYSEVFSLFLQPKSMRFGIRRKIVLGKDLYNIANGRFDRYEEDSQKKIEGQYNNEYEDYLLQASKLLVSNIHKGLSQVCNVTMNDDFNAIEIPYDNDILNKVKASFYATEGATIEDDNENKKYERFLYKRNQLGYTQYCAPDLSHNLSTATSLPYYWCSGHPCFYSKLNEDSLQRLEEVYGHVMWKHFDILTISDIMGYPLAKRLTNGYQSSQVLRTYIAIINKVAKIFPRIKCSSCGHMLFVGFNGPFGTYSHFNCHNKNCQEKGKDVYLNYCYKCGKGLIDSRVTAKCPNDLCVCPSCISCCDDGMFQRQANKYLQSNGYVPQWLRQKLGHGHNDKGIFFCPKCGSQLDKYKEKNTNNEYLLCPKCNIRYSKDNKNISSF